jgi:amidase
MPTVISGEVIYSFSADMSPAFTVPDGAQLEVRCPDGLHGQVRTETDVYQAVDPDHVNDAVGPIYVEGAEPGDTLKVSIDRIDVPQESGYVILIPGFGLLKDRITEPRTKIVPVKDRQVSFNGLTLAVDPCIGTIGVAPESGSYSTILPGDHGGNLDTTDIRGGSALYLPVRQPGALLAMGDPKAVMGDGETSGTGVGVPIDIHASVRVLHGFQLRRPVVETQAEYQFVASAETIEDAARQALSDVIEVLRALRGWDWQESYMFASLAGHMRISQLVNPLMTVRLGLPKNHLWGLFDAAQS